MINVRTLHHGESFGLWRAACVVYFPHIICELYYIYQLTLKKENQIVLQLENCIPNRHIRFIVVVYLYIQLFLYYSSVDDC